MENSYERQKIKSIKGRKEEIVIEEVALRTMMKAVYATKNIGHFGLGFDDYTHFTSPIRRYPDLIVHRLLKQYEEGGEAQQFGEKIQFLSVHGTIQLPEIQFLIHQQMGSRSLMLL